MAVRSLRFVLTGDDKSASKSLDRVGKKADGLGRKLGGLATMGGAAAGAGIVAFGVSSVKAFADAQKAQAGLEQSFKRFPKLGDTSLKSMQGFNSALATKTKYDDDAIASGETVLATFGLTGDQIKKITPRLLDYASLTGKDLPEAARDLGKATQGQGKALKGIGLQLKDLKDPAKNFTAVMDGLNQKVGGFATNEGQTASGQVQILKNRFGELQETVGEQLLPVITGFVGWLNDKGVPALQSFADGFKDGKGAGGELRDILGEIKTAFQTAADIGNKTIMPILRWMSDHPDAMKGIAASMAAYATAMRAAAIWSAFVKPVPPATGVPGGVAGKAGKTPWLVGGPAVAIGAAIGVGAGYVDPKLGPLGSGGKAGTSLGNPKDYYKGADGKYYPKKKPKPGQAAPPMISPDSRRAGGGPMRSGLTYLVGEQGPELVTPRRSGYVHTAAKTRSIFNPRARLDPSQVRDLRDVDQFSSIAKMLTGRGDHWRPGQTGLTPMGMGQWYRESATATRAPSPSVAYHARPISVQVTLSRSKVAKQTATEQRRRARNGHPLPFGL